MDLRRIKGSLMKIDDSVVAAARGVGSIIANHVDATERDRRLAPPVVEALLAKGLFVCSHHVRLAASRPIRSTSRTSSKRCRAFRDAETVRHHGFVSESRLETVGQVNLGVATEFPFVAF